MTGADPEALKRIELWSTRAGAYDLLIQGHDPLASLAARLVELVRPEEQDVFDVGGGSGLLTGLLLTRFPEANVTLQDPAAGMVALARARFGDRVTVEQRSIEAAGPAGAADLVLANACFHMADLERGLSAVSALLRPGGRFLFNLWWHSWEPTAGEERSDDLWRVPLSQVLTEHGEDPAQLPPEPERSAPWSPPRLAAAASSSGLAVEVLPCDEDEAHARFFFDFAAMDATLLGAHPHRVERLREARARCEGVRVLRSTRFVLQRAQATPAGSP
ncbi:MAG: class I SAM-dependent methyltransferase [Planctomycetota bacterium]|nr:class I SAM-dependent methyltransferase [Planctomycetota bacterium]